MLVLRSDTSKLVNDFQFILIFLHLRGAIAPTSPHPLVSLVCLRTSTPCTLGALNKQTSDSVVVHRPCPQHAVSTAAHYLGSTLSCWFCSALVSQEPWASPTSRARSRRESKVKLLVSLHTKVQIKFPCLRISGSKSDLLL